MSSVAEVQTATAKSPRPAVDLSPMPGILARYPREEPSLIQILQDVHRVYNYLPPEALAEVAAAVGVPLAKVYSVATFYKAFSLEPQGKVLVKVCTGTACHIRGAPQLVEELERELGVKPGGTTSDMGYTVRTVNCVGACAMAPVLIVAGKYHGGAKATKVKTYLGRGSRS
jgi:NADH:ubiquinone oxidoreductase subunit E